MANDDRSQPARQISPFQFVILILSIYVLFALLYQQIFRPSEQVVHLLDLFDFAVCMVFLYDFFYRLAVSKNKLKFLRWGWIDLISSIPVFNVFRWARLVRIVRLLRLLRAFKSTKSIITYLFQYRASNGLAIAALISFFLVLFASLAILSFETSPAAHIRTIVDAMWWSFSSISSTSSGDAYPTSAPGKLLAIVLSITGIGLFSTLTAFVAKLFLEPNQKHEDMDLKVMKKQLDELLTKIDALSSRLSNK